MKRVTAVIVATVLLVTTFGQVAAATPGDPSFRGTNGYGINMNGMDSDPAVAAGQVAQLQQDTDVQWMRLSATWADLEPIKGSFDWAWLDAMVDIAEQNNMKVLLIPFETPDWARPAGAPSDWSGAKYPPANNQDYADFIQALVTRYAPRGVLDYEIWNEANVSNFFAPQPDPVKYVGLLQAAHTAAHAVNPNVNIIAGATAPAGDAGDGSSLSPMTFLEQVYQQGGKDYFDAVSHHPYGFPYPPSEDADWNSWQIMSKSYGTQKSLRQIMVENGDSAKKIWLTEYGAHTSGEPSTVVSEQEQADMISEAIDLHASYDWAGPLFLFAYRDELPYGASSSREPYFGLYRADGSPKLAVAAVASAFAQYPAPIPPVDTNGPGTPTTSSSPGAETAAATPGAPNTGAEPEASNIPGIVAVIATAGVAVVATYRRLKPPHAIRFSSKR